VTIYLIDYNKIYLIINKFYSIFIQPPCCIAQINCLLMTLEKELDKQNVRSCLIGGQVFGSVKMNGKQLPWDVDLDVDVSKEQWDSVTKYVIPALQKKLKLSGGARVGPNGYAPQIWKKVVYAEMTYSGGTRLDLYPFKEKIYPCSWPYHFKEGENETSIFMEGRWTKVPKNPARHLRGLSSNYLKHATWTLVGDRKISDTPKFGECGKIPEGKTKNYFNSDGIKTLPYHACLNQYAADGNMQFSHPSFLQAHPGH